MYRNPCTFQRLCLIVYFVFCSEDIHHLVSKSSKTEQMYMYKFFGSSFFGGGDNTDFSTEDS